MNDIITGIGWVLAALAGLGLLIWIGFQIPSRFKAPSTEKKWSLRYLSSEAKKHPVIQFLFPDAAEKILIPNTCVAWGRGAILTQRLPLFGALWMPLRWTLYLRPGSEFRLNLRLFWFGRTIIVGKDEFAAGHGTFIMGNYPSKGENIDSSEQTLLWLYTLLLTPAALISLVSDLEFAGDTLKINHPLLPDQAGRFTLTVDAQEKILTRINTVRKASRDGRLLPFFAMSSDPKDFSLGYPLPSKIQLAWEDGPYLKLKVQKVHYNADVKNELDAE